jgi:uncharacterized protein (DUF433 family)
VDLPQFLVQDKHGQVFCTGHRIGLVDIVYFFNEGYSAEMIASQFPTLALSLIYKVIGFYLDNRTEVDRYVAHEQRRVDQQRAKAAKGPQVPELRRRLAQMHHVEVV